MIIRSQALINNLTNGQVYDPRDNPFSATLCLSVSLSLFLSASLLSAHPFPFHIKDVPAQEKVSVDKHISTNVVLSSKGCLNTHVLYVYIIISMALSC